MKINDPFKRAAWAFLETLGFIALCVALTACIGIVAEASLNHLESLGFSTIKSILIAASAYSLLLALFAAFLAYWVAK